MRKREYGQYCGLARAAEIVGQRWALLILRDLLVKPRRYSDLRSELPGIPTNMLAIRLKELEADGLVTRQALSGSDRSIVYRVTDRGAEIAPAIEALAYWGATGMREPREGEVVTEASLVTALRVAGGTRATRPDASFTVKVADAVASATISDGAVVVEPGEHPDPDLTIVGGAGFRDFLAGRIDPQTAIADGVIELTGETALLADFAAVFFVPYSESALP